MWLKNAMQNWRGKQQADAELDEEVHGYVDMLADEKMRNSEGMPAHLARREAHMEMGGVEQVKERTREVRAGHFLETLWQDIRYGARMLRKSPTFTAVAVFTLALGIGANTAIFSVVDAVMLRPLPYPNPSQLADISVARPQQGISFAGASYLDLQAWREQTRAFSQLAGLAFHKLTLTGGGDPTVVNTVVVTSDFSSLLEVKPLLGSTLLPGDFKRGAAPTVVLSENLWRSRFGADPKLVGRSITLDHRSFTVAGIMPSAFRSPFIDASDPIWIPFAQDPVFSTFMSLRNARGIPVLGRLKPGVSLEQAQTEMDSIGANLTKQFPASDAGFSIHVEPLQQAIVGNAKTALLVLLGAVGLVLLIACANIANLLLARATARTREMGIRIVLGAGRARVIRQLLTESALLGLIGGLAGILLAYWGVAALVSLLPASLPQLHVIAVDGRVLAFALVLSIAASLAFGLAPALLAAGANLQSNLKEGAGYAGEGGARRRARNFLAVAEISLAMVLVVAGGLLLRSFIALTSVNPGFDTRDVWKAEISLPQYEYSTPQQWTVFSNQLLQRIQAQPGLQDCALAAPLPMDAQGSATLPFTIAGNPPLPRGTVQDADFVSVSPNYFHVMAIRLLRGRLFSAQDSMSAPRVTIISQTMARRYFPNEDPLGRHLVLGFPFNGGIVSREIVGIVGDIRDATLNQKPQPMMYVPFAQAPFYGGELVVKTALNPASIAASIRQQVRDIDPNLPVTDFASLSYAVQLTTAQPRFRTLLLGLFGLIALVLAAAGIFGVISYSTARRTHEIGIRMALGAQPWIILRMVLYQGARLAAAGLAVGFVAALILTRFLRTMLFEIKPADALTFAAVAILLALVVLAACYIPARRAMKVDPMVALRYQ
ncbi:MAG TPA: ABC transporter permease [Candidatus Acidoferrales bacterium]|nr:ABC transporter permease [Candidatus Acidoferrales bacterium]